MSNIHLEALYCMLKVAFVRERRNWQSQYTSCKTCNFYFTPIKMWFKYRFSFPNTLENCYYQSERNGVRMSQTVIITCKARASDNTCFTKLMP